MRSPLAIHQGLYKERLCANTTKMQREDAQNEFKLLQCLHQTQIATPEPYHLDLSGTILPNPYLIIEFIEGEMCLAPETLDTHVVQLANQLAAIHHINPSTYDLSFLPIKSTPCVERTQHKSSSNKRMRESAIRQSLMALTTRVNRNPNVLCHGDFWPGNSLWQEGQLTAVIDWEDAYLGDPLRDLAISRLDIVWIFGIEAMHQFTDQYLAQMPIDITNLPYWDLCAALRLIRMAGDDLEGWVNFFPQYGRNDITVESLLSDYDYFVSKAIKSTMIEK